MWRALLLTAVLQADAPPALPEGHPPTNNPGAAAPSAQQLLEKLDAQPDLKTKPKTFEVALSMGKLYYANGRYADAEPILKRAVAQGETLRKLARDLKKQGISPAAACPSEEPFEPLAQLAAEQAKQGQREVALACAQKAFSRGWVEAQRLWAYSQLVDGKSAPALEALSGLLEAVEDGEARYARAALMLEEQGDDKKALQQVKTDLTAAAALPNHPRAADARLLLGRVTEIVAAGGVTAYGAQQNQKARTAAPPAPKAGEPPALTQAMVDAVQNTERTPELEQGMAKLVEEAEQSLAQEKFQEALDAYKRVVPFQPENARARAGMAWALVGLNRQPMADRVWGVAVSSSAEAVDKLGDALKAKGNVKGAKALWSKLAQSNPDYAKGAKLESKLQ